MDDPTLHDDQKPSCSCWREDEPYKVWREPTEAELIKRKREDDIAFHRAAARAFFPELFNSDGSLKNKT